MHMPIRPILSSLRHHRLTAALLALQVALTCAIAINALFLIHGRIERINTTTGIPEEEISLVSVRGLNPDANPLAQQDSDLAALRAIPGVTAAVAIGSTLPLSGGANDIGGCADQASIDRAIALHTLDQVPGCIQSTFYEGSPGFVQALGAHLIAGRDFNADEYTDSPSVGIITRSLAQRLWPGQTAIGKVIYGGSQYTVIGVIDDLLRPRLRDASVDHLVTLWPRRPDDVTARYLLRSTAQDRPRVLAAAAAALAKSGPVRLQPDNGQRTFSEVRRKYFQRDSTMVGLLLVATCGLLFVTALGIGGLANFWVAQRTRQIGIRRAIGATRGDILRHFQTENFLIVSVGVVLGVLLALLLNQWLMSRYELPRLPLAYLPVGALALWLLGQIAVFGPARRAAAIPPAVATRST